MYESYGDYNLGGALMVTRSTDGGLTWLTPLQIAPGTPFIRDVAHQITGDLGGGGNVYLAGMNEGGGGLSPRINMMYRSTNGGVSFTGVAMGPSFYPPGLFPYQVTAYGITAATSATWAGDSLLLSATSSTMCMRWASRVQTPAT